MNSDNATQVLCILGPTASGKTGLAVELCQKLPFEIISVDSALVYRGMDIGTAKPDANTLRVAPHALIDIVDPWDTYSVSRFLTDVRCEISRIDRAGRIPVLAGGTMLYFKSLWQGLSDLPESSAEIREQLQRQAERDGWDSLHAELAEVDPESAARIHPNDPQRISRALEVYRIVGEPLSQRQQRRIPLGSYSFFNVGIVPADRSVLHSNIAIRYDQMLEQGFVEEVQELINKPEMGVNLPSMRCVGYRQVCAMLQNHCTYDEMRERGIAATRQLAKRQLTWMRRMDNLHPLSLAPTLADLHGVTGFNDWVQSIR